MRIKRVTITMGDADIFEEMLKEKGFFYERMFRNFSIQDSDEDGIRELLKTLKYSFIIM